MSALPNDQDVTTQTHAELTVRLLDTIRNAETEQSLDWLEQFAKVKGYDAASIAVAFQRRRAEIRNRPATLF